MGDSRIKDVSALLSSFFDEGRLRKGERFSEFFSSWSSLAGARLAAHSRVADVDKGILVIEAEHPGWIQLLQLSQARILEDAARRYPELNLRGIVFRLAGQGAGVLPPASRAPDDGDDAATEEEEAVPEAESPSSSLEEIADPEFRALLASLRKTMQGERNH